MTRSPARHRLEGEALQRHASLTLADTKVPPLKEREYAHTPILARPILGPGSVHTLPWLGQGGIYTDPGPRMGLARIGVCAYLSSPELAALYGC